MDLVCEVVGVFLLFSVSKQGLYASLQPPRGSTFKILKKEEQRGHIIPHRKKEEIPADIH